MPLVLAYKLDRPAEVWLTTPPNGQASEKLVLLATLDPDILAEIPPDGGVLLTLGGNPTSIDEAAALASSGSVTVEIVNYEKVVALWVSSSLAAFPPTAPSR
ncbi:MAG: hypothetical protein LC739_00550 [Actinobacteria bacterium]|nr:hypothetical protein [Actinomycetota bacterium]